MTDKLNNLKSDLNSTLSSLKDNNIALKATIVGAYCSLKLAIEEGYKDDIDKKLNNNYLNSILTNDEDKDLTKLWNAGLHYNSTIYRISSAYHRTLKVLVYGYKDHYPKEFINDLKDKLKIDINTPTLDKTNHLVNNLKHNVFGNNGKRIKIEELFKNFYELIELINKISKIP